MAEAQQASFLLTFFSLFLMISYRPSAARPLSTVGLRDGSAEETVPNIALPGQGVDNALSLSAHPCTMANMSNNMATGSSTASKAIKRRYPPLVLNILPRGFIPPSGPSDGSNDIKN